MARKIVNNLAQKNQNKNLKRTKIVLFSIFIVLFIISFYSIFSKINTNGWKVFQRNLGDLFRFSNIHPYYSDSLFNLSFEFLWITIKYTLSGTFFGTIFAFITAFLSSQFIKNKFLQIIIWWVIIILKCFPIPFVIDPFRLIFAPKLAAFLIIFWFTWIWLHRYFYSFLNSLDLNSYKKVTMKGQNRFFAFKNEILPFVVNKFFALFLFSFEANVRWTTIISATGLMGIGTLINDGLQNSALGWRIVGIPLLVLLFFSLILEFLAIFFNKFILYKKSIGIQQKNLITLWIKTNYDRVLKVCFVIFVLILTIVSLNDIKNWAINTYQLNRFFNSLFVFDSGVFILGKLDNPIYMIFDLFAQIIVCVSIISLASIFMAIMSNEKLNHFSKWIIYKFFLNLFRITPAIIIFYLFLSFTIRPILWAAILVGFNNGIMLAKKLNETINSIDWQKYKLLRLSQWSKTKTIFHYVLPSISKEYFKYLTVEISNSVHDLLFYGIFGGSLLGLKISTLSQTGIAGDRPGFFTYSWIAWFLILIIEITIITIEKAYFKKFLYFSKKISNLILKKFAGKKVF
ncbi:ABC transporter permease subunit [Mesomycoplasma flocculare]|uniref:ABC transporter permease protein n=1 Tax=Mesomycoplasma flocculare ATCC 27399 TaxID=743971 RepID=A0A0A8E6E5_MESFC|nr:ABC transporter permease protein [Mesomycoplasma flocculare ATCC 27399]